MGLMTPGDVNGDGLQDLVIASVGSAQLVLGTEELMYAPLLIARYARRPGANGTLAR